VNSKIANWLELHVHNDALRIAIFLLIIPAVLVELAIRDNGDFSRY
jgi:hypothetical protein